MKNFGELYKLMRTSRHLSLKEATGGEFSTSMLSRFENNQADMSAQKLFKCLDNIYTTLHEFEYLAREFQKSELTKLIEAIDSFSNPFQKEKMESLAERELSKIKLDQKQQFHTLNSILIKARIKAFDSSYPLEDKDMDFVRNYLFTTDTWGQYELTLFSETVQFFDARSYIYYCREMLHRSDFFLQLPYHSTLIQTILVNGLFLLSERKEFTAAAYLVTTIERLFGDTRDAFMRIVFMIAKGYYQWQKGDKAGQALIQKGIDLFDTLGYQNQASYYQAEFTDILDQAQS